jgi:hypothetical protein
MAQQGRRAGRVGLRCSPRGRRGCFRWRHLGQLRAVSTAHDQLFKILTAKAFRDLLDTLGTPGSLRIDDSNATFSAALFLRQLSDDSHGVRKLSLATSCRQSVGHRVNAA